MVTYTMDKSWINLNDRSSDNYFKGIELFLKFSKENNKRIDNLILCPCRTCINTKFKTYNKVGEEIFRNGFSSSYTEWIYHGEGEFDESDTSEDGDYVMNDESEEFNADICDMLAEMDELEPQWFSEFVKNSKVELYPGCKESVLSAVLKLMHIKVRNRWSNKSFDMLLEFIKCILPEGDTLPSSYYAAKRMLDEMGLGYQEIDACKYDCALFYKENSDAESCPICGESRWEINDGKGRKTPHKTLRHFPLKPQLQRLFMFSKTASKMRWHKVERKVEEGVMRHPADSLAWKHVNEQYTDFHDDPRNVRFGLATDGFTPWSNLGNSYSMWPVILVPYNLSGYMFMKEEFLITSLLIPGPKSPERDLDVYLRPLIDELKELWDTGIATYDAFSKEYFQLRGMVMWTISDFPAYGSLSGWVTMGRKSCPVCLDETRSEPLRSKTGFIGHRCFLPKDHRWRKDKRSFNGREENRPKPKELSGEDVLRLLNSLLDLFNKPGKHPKLNRKRKRGDNQSNWVKKSIFYELPYWSVLLIRHVLDVMHIEKNICDNIIATLLDILYKSKDNEKAREDLRDMGIREELHMLLRGRDEKPVKHVACYNLSSAEKDKFLEFLKSVKVPDGYAANISRCVRDKKLTGLKSHDCHILLQRLIPAGTRGLLKKEVHDALCELGEFFRELCSKTLRVDDLKRLQKNIPLILCKLEKIFPPAFFTVMVHLAVHLPSEALLTGPVHPRWMYPIERKIGCMKRSIRNKAHPEASASQDLCVKQALTFYSMFFNGVETRYNQRTRNYDGFEGGQVGDPSIFSMRTRPFGIDRKVFVKSGPAISDELLQKAHDYILWNCEEVELYLNQYKAEALGVTLEEATELEVNETQRKQFWKWFKTLINGMRDKRNPEATDGLWALANGPFRLDTKCYTGCMVNEVRFHTKDRDANRRTQNSGIVVEGQYENDVDEYFGFLSRVVELAYLGSRKVVLFQCEWFNTGNKKSIQKDRHFTSINVASRWYKDDPFVLPINVNQVFYVDDMKLGKNWQLVQRVQHRHLWDLPKLESDDTLINPSHMVDPMQQFESGRVHDVIENEEELSRKLVREDLEPIEVDELLFHEVRQATVSRNEVEHLDGDDEDVPSELDYLENATFRNGVDFDMYTTEDDEFEALNDSDDEDFFM